MESIVRNGRSSKFALLYILMSLFAHDADARTLRDEQHYEYQSSLGKTASSNGTNWESCFLSIDR